MGDPEVLYKLALAADVPENAWRTRLEWMTAFVGDKSTKFITLYSAEQLAAAAEASFAGRADVMLLSFSTEPMDKEADLKIKCEDGAFNVYGGAIPYACLHAAPVPLALGSDGKHTFPLLGEAAVAAALLLSEQQGEESEDGTDDGLEPFDQCRFDEDD